MRKNLAELKLVGEVDGKQVGGSGEPPEDLEFVDALIHHADALQARLDLAAPRTHLALICAASRPHLAWISPSSTAPPFLWLSLFGFAD